MKDNLSTADWIASLTGCSYCVNIICRGTHFSAGICLALWMKNIPSFTFPAEQAAPDKWNGIMEIIRSMLATHPLHKSGPSSHHISALPDHKDAWEKLLSSDPSVLSSLIYILHKQNHNETERHSLTLYFRIFNCWSMKWQLHRTTFTEQLSMKKIIYHHLKS